MIAGMHCALDRPFYVSTVKTESSKPFWNWRHLQFTLSMAPAPMWVATETEHCTHFPPYRSSWWVSFSATTDLHSFINDSASLHTCHANTVWFAVLYAYLAISNTYTTVCGVHSTTWGHAYPHSSGPPAVLTQVHVYCLCCLGRCIHKTTLLFLCSSSWIASSMQYMCILIYCVHTKLYQIIICVWSSSPRFRTLWWCRVTNQHRLSYQGLCNYLRLRYVWGLEPFVLSLMWSSLQYSLWINSQEDASNFQLCVKSTKDDVAVGLIGMLQVWISWYQCCQSFSNSECMQFFIPSFFVGHEHPFSILLLHISQQLHGGGESSVQNAPVQFLVRRKVAASDSTPGKWWCGRWGWASGQPTQLLMSVAFIGWLWECWTIKNSYRMQWCTGFLSDQSISQFCATFSWDCPTN